MSGIQNSLYLVAIALCLFSTAILSGKIRRAGQPFSYFTAYLAIESLCFLFELLVAHPATPLKALWLGLLMATSLFVAPCLWLAIKESIDGVHPTLSSVSWGHGVVVLAGVLLTVPLIETSHFGQGFDDPARVVPTLFSGLIHETMLLCIAVFALQVPYYLWQCRRMLLQKSASGKQASDKVDPRGWLQIALIIVCTTWLLGVARTLASAVSDGSPEFFALVAFVDVSVTIGCVYMIVRRVAFSGSLAHAQSADPFREPESKYAKSQLDSAIRARIARKLQAAFRTDEVYRDCRLSLGSLSARLNENEHYVSQVINQELGTTFYEFVAAYRIEHAKKLLIESPELNVLDIALSVGFNAKSTFNSAFRRHTEMTPREFRSHSKEATESAAPHKEMWPERTIRSD